MAWDRFHKTINSNGGVECTTGYMSETITLGDNADASTSYIPGPLNSDVTILAIFSADLGSVSTDTYVQVEHSVDNSTWVKSGVFDTTTVATTDISHDMSKIAVIDDSAQGEDDGVMMLYLLDSHGAARYTRFTIKANGQDESSKTCTFHIIPHF